MTDWRLVKAHYSYYQTWIQKKKADLANISMSSLVYVNEGIDVLTFRLGWR